MDDFLIHQPAARELTPHRLRQLNNWSAIM